MTHVLLTVNIKGIDENFSIAEGSDFLEMINRFYTQRISHDTFKLFIGPSQTFGSAFLNKCVKYKDHVRLGWQNGSLNGCFAKEFPVKNTNQLDYPVTIPAEEDDQETIETHTYPHDTSKDGTMALYKFNHKHMTLDEFLALSGTLLSNAFGALGKLEAYKPIIEENVDK